MTYQSRLLQSLDQHIQQCTDQTDRTRLISRRAIHLARLNQIDSAKAEITNLRSEIGSALDPASGAWVLLAEGIIEYFDFELDKAFDRLRRSEGISISMGMKPIIAASSAWLSHVTYQKSRYDDSIRSLLLSMDAAASDDNFSRCRASVVAANLYGLANKFDVAKSWQMRARNYATLDGDDASQAAILFNSTIFRVNQVRLASAFQVESEADLNQIQMELESSQTFDSFSNGSALPGNPSMLKGYILNARGRYQDAIESLQSALIAGTHPLDQTSIDADLAFAYISIGKLETGRSKLESSLQSLKNVVDDDDIAFVHARIAKCWLFLGDDDRHAVHSRAASESLGRYRAFQDSLRSQLVVLPSPEHF